MVLKLRGAAGSNVGWGELECVVAPNFRLAFCILSLTNSDAIVFFSQKNLCEMPQSWPQFLDDLHMSTSQKCYVHGTIFRHHRLTCTLSLQASRSISIRVRCLGRLSIMIRSIRGRVGACGSSATFISISYSIAIVCLDRNFCASWKYQYS